MQEVKEKGIYCNGDVRKKMEQIPKRGKVFRKIIAQRGIKS